MRILNLFKKNKINISTNIIQNNDTQLEFNKNVELAEQLFNTQILGTDVDLQYKQQVNKILNECTPRDKKYPERQQVLLKVVELIGEPKTPKERFLVAKSYAWSKVQYRDKAIYYLKLYLENELWKDAYIHKIHNYGDTERESKLYHLKEIYEYLAKAYIGKYDFDEALKIYEYLINIFPEHPSAYCGKYECLLKQNKLNECFEWIKKVKKSKYYKIYYKDTILNTKIKDTWFKDTIDNILNDVVEKIKKGYIYKPRKNK